MYSINGEVELGIVSHYERDVPSEDDILPETSSLESSSDTSSDVSINSEIETSSLSTMYECRLLGEQLYFQFLDPITTLYPISPGFSKSPLRKSNVYLQLKDIETIKHRLFSVDEGEYVLRRDLFSHVQFVTAKVLVRLCLHPKNAA
jgi:hypothetical protein